MHERHEDEQYHQIDRKERDTHVVRDQSEERRHETGADVGACHLYADDCLRPFCTEMIRCGVDDARVYRSASQTDDDQTRKGNDIRTGQEHDDDAGGDDPLSQTDHLHIIQLHRDETADRPADSDADEEHAGKACGGFRGDPFKQIEITACPQAGGLFDGTVAEEAEHDFLRSGDPYDLCERERSAFCLVRYAVRRLYLRSVLLFRPERQAEDQESCQYDLKYADIAVTGIPRLPAGKGESHDIRTESRAHAPHTVEPAHVVTLIVERHVIIQRRVHTAGAQPVGDCPETEHPERAGKGKSEQCGSGHCHADGSDFPCPQLPGEPVALKTGYDRACRDDHGYDPGVRYGNAEFRVHRRPCGPQQGVRQAETDKCQIYDRK